ncbi:MAG: macro domain-containing protein [Candidatus Limnocylindria bacterium]
MAGQIEIDVWQGELAELEVDALVVSANESLFMTAGAAASVKRHGGDEIERDAVDQGPTEPGTAIATRAGSLAAAYVIHAIGVGHDRIADHERLSAAIRTALTFSEPLRLRRMAFSLLGVEHGVFSADEAAAVLADELTRTATDGQVLESIVIATTNPVETHAVTNALAARRAHVT